MNTRPLTIGERKIAQSVFGDDLDLDAIQIKRWKWWPFQPLSVLMTPCGHVHVAANSPLWSDDYSQERLGLQGLLIHELTHSLQTQQRGKFYLPLMRHPFCRYGYTFKPGQPFERYGLEQQAEIMRHIFLLRQGVTVPNAPSLAELESLMPIV